MSMYMQMIHHHLHPQIVFVYSPKSKTNEAERRDYDWYILRVADVFDLTTRVEEEEEVETAIFFLSMKKRRKKKELLDSSLYY